MPGPGGSLSWAWLTLATASAMSAVPIGIVVLVFVFRVCGSVCCACAIRPRRHGLTVILNELFVRCCRCQIFHYSGDAGAGNPSCQWQKHVGQERVTHRLDVSTWRRSHPRGVQNGQHGEKANSYVEPTTLDMLAGASPASAMDGWTEE